MRALPSACALLVCLAALPASAGITGEYLEARTCDVYTGPCFANGEMDLAGKEAVLAWKVDAGTWRNVDLAGLGVAVVLNSSKTLGDDGIFGLPRGNVKAVIVVDERADQAQRDALIDFARENAGDLAENVVAVHSAPIDLKNDHLDGTGVFTAGDLAKIETRALVSGDCVCTNEEVFYQPLTKVENASPAYSVTSSWQGTGLDRRWTSHGQRSAFLATFRK